MSHMADHDLGATPPAVERTGGDGPASTDPEAEVTARRGWSRQRIALVLIAAVALVWLLVKAADDPRKFAVVTLNGVTLAALFFVVASGFTLIFGLMRVVNMAHGSLYLFGGYLALEMQNKWFVKEAGGPNLGLSLSGNDEASIGLMGWLVPLLLATAVISL